MKMQRNEILSNAVQEYKCIYSKSNKSHNDKVMILKETRNSFKKLPLNLWWISNKTIMEIGNVTKAATFKSFLHQSYKNTQLSLFVTVIFNYIHKTNINQWFWGVKQKQELRVFFKRMEKGCWKSWC